MTLTPEKIREFGNLGFSPQDYLNYAKQLREAGWGTAADVMEVFPAFLESVNQADRLAAELRAR